GTEDIFKRSQAMFDSMFSGFADFFGSRRRALPFGGFGMPTMLLPELLMPGFGRQSDTAEETGAENAVNEQSQAQTAADGEMNVRRQINMLRSQMQDAVNAEEFEKAAELRDKIRELEKDSDK
ncbi:MAG: UvrB/UvrC motif-containing protein, partial [Oscillospiraceae bacterium]|nr:UvrB/UvrC motif-containing protein [Oscillospiraceae bacterium]